MKLEDFIVLDLKQDERESLNADLEVELHMARSGWISIREDGRNRSNDRRRISASISHCAGSLSGA
jgi:hypothetical protein